MVTSNRLNHIVLSLVDYWKYWIIPAALGLLCGTFYAFFLHTPMYTARQSLIVRDDLMGDSFKPSQFESLDYQKNAQETILEIARKPEVIRNVLKQVKHSSFFGSGEVSDHDVEDMQGNITFGAPNGAEFGRTEAVVLKVTSDQRGKAKTLTQLLLDEIDKKLVEVRRLRLKSMEKELSMARDQAAKMMRQSSKKLQEIEKSFGAGITTIRGLNDPQGGGNPFDLKVNQIQVEHRQAITALASAKEQKRLLLSASANGSLDLVTSSQLLELQPALRAMLESLNKAQEKLAVDEGRYKSLHPALKASREAVRFQKESIFNSLGNMIKGLDSQIAMAESQVSRLGNSIVKHERKLSEITEQRVPYAALAEELTNKSKAYHAVQAQLSKIQSYASSEEGVGLLTRIGEPQVGTRPNGLGTKALMLVGLLGGLIAGLGLVALVVPTTPSFQPPVAQNPVGYSVPPGQYAQSVPDQYTNVPPSADTVSESRLRSVAQLEQQRKQAKDGFQAQPTASPAVSIPKPAPTPVNVAATNASLAPAPTSATTAASKPTERPVQPKPAAVKPDIVVASSAPPAAAQASSEERPKMSSADVIAAFKKSQKRNAQNRKPSPPTSTPKVTPALSPAPQTQAPPSQAAPQGTSNAASATQNSATKEEKPSESIESIRETFKALEASKEKHRQQQQLKPQEQLPLRKQTVSQPDIVVVDRKTATTKASETISADRITAESLIQSSELRVKGGARAEPPADMQGVGVPRLVVSSTPVDTSILQKVKAELEDPSGTGNNQQSLRSITEFAQSMENPIDEAVSKSAVEALRKETDSRLELERRPANVRPVDIVKSLAEHDSVRGMVNNIRPGEPDSESEAKESVNAKLRKKVPSIPTDNSLAGLMRQVRDSGTVVPQGTGSDVLPTEKEPRKKEKPAEKAPKKRTQHTNTETNTAIPTQIKELSDSISSFARPNQSTQ